MSVDDLNEDESPKITISLVRKGWVFSSRVGAWRESDKSETPLTVVKQGRFGNVNANAYYRQCQLPPKLNLECYTQEKLMHNNMEQFI